TAAKDDDEASDDEVEITGTLKSLSPVTVMSATKTVTCILPAGSSLAGFAVGDLVEVTCDLKAGVLVLRKIEHEDEDEDEAEVDEDRGANSGPGNADDEAEHDNGGPGGGGSDGHGGHSGPGGGGDD